MATKHLNPGNIGSNHDTLKAPGVPRRFSALNTKETRPAPPPTQAEIQARAEGYKRGRRNGVRDALLVAGAGALIFAGVEATGGSGVSVAPIIESIQTGHGLPGAPDVVIHAGVSLYSSPNVTVGETTAAGQVPKGQQLHAKGGVFYINESTQNLWIGLPTNGRHDVAHPNLVWADVSANKPQDIVSTSQGLPVTAVELGALNPGDTTNNNDNFHFSLKDGEFYIYANGEKPVPVPAANLEKQTTFPQGL